MTNPVPGEMNGIRKEVPMADATPQGPTATPDLGI